MPDPLFLDKKSILENMGGDEELLIEMAQMYLTEHGEYIQNLEQAISGSDSESLRREAHTLKSLFATFADEAGRELAITVEQQAKSGQMDTALTQSLCVRIQLLADTLSLLMHTQQ